ncbi:branched-chain-amino-acid transaminase [Cellulosilyticum lentocellum]|uniref:Branched-chain-amino-acid aminotransferase n=1 Tax=Cellulosilyticum lentocellum (strain ATCC 49066 / DSM 5427 / NCIMB 11756 / RHM5) TaxID=642492 RepID=F2JL07_CELLD|nr:branched-chain-amino-acid transaminase [Cellulosilyticum lentocellum]ADZ84548.1 branched-chain amino acid aminotransferase [Cellulosilyticum lentocellum DSM 5427]
MSSQIIYLDGQYVEEGEAKISVFDHGVLYGDGVFEGIRAYNGRIFRCEDHIDRLYAAAKAIMLEIPLTKEEMTEVLLETCRRNDLRDGYIRLVVTRGKGDLGLSPKTCPKATVFCIAGNITMYPEEMYTKGMPIITSVQRRNKATIVDPQIKSLNYLNNILAKMEANRAGVPEALMLNHDGIVAECTGDNIFIVKDGVIYTPPIHIGILDGITRRTVIELAAKLGFALVEKEFTLFNVYNADECFLTGTAAEAIPVSMVDGRVIGTGNAGEVTKTLLAAFKAYANEQGTDIF